MTCVNSNFECKSLKSYSRIFFLFKRGESFDGTTVGMASQSSMCTKDRSGGVNVVRLVMKFYWTS